MRNDNSLRSTVIAVTVLVALALLVRLPEIGHRVFIDELMHVLSARSLLDSGTLQLTANGSPYTRAALFTYLIAGLFRVFGESLIVARIPALVAGVALVVVLFLWLRSVAGPLAAWTAAVLLSLNPEAVYLSQWCRFYTLQTLLLFLGAIAVYSLVHRPTAGWSRIGRIAAAAVCFALAMHLQVLSTICLLTLAMWLTIVLAPRLLSLVRGPRERIYLIVLALVVVGAVALLIESGFVAYAWRMFRHVAPWAERSRNDHSYYHWFMLAKYATLWTLFPLACLLALARYRRPAFFCCCVFCAGFLLQSAAAWKSNRYIFWAMPFFFAIVGMAFDPALAWIRRRLRDALRETPELRLGPRTIGVAVDASLVLALLFAAAGNRAFLETRSLMTDESTEPRLIRPEANWDSALPMLREAAREADVIGSAEGPKSLYFLGRLDFALDYKVGDVEPSGADYSNLLAAPLVRSADAFERVIGCHPTGLVILEQHHAGGKVSRAIMRELDDHAVRLPLPPGWRLEAYRWDRPPNLPEMDCDEDPIALGARHNEDEPVARGTADATSTDEGGD